MATKENDDLQYSTQLFERRMGDLDIADTFFETLREDYPGFDEWFNAHPERSCFVQYNPNGAIDGLLILKLEEGPIEEVEPPINVQKAIKVCTFKINPHSTKLGQRFIRLIINSMIDYHADCIYCTIFEKHTSLTRLLSEYGFEQAGVRKDTGESVYSKSLCTTHGDISKDYPRINTEGVRFYSLAIKPEYHTQMFPDAILQTEHPSIIEDLPHTNAIEKVYICSMRNVANLHEGDILFIRRTQAVGYSSAPANYTACITSVCTVKEVRKASSFATLDSLYEYTSPYNLFSRAEVERYYNDNSYAIKMVFNFPLKKRLINQRVREILGQDPQYWGFFELNKEQAYNILQKGEVYEGFIIN